MLLASHLFFIHQMEVQSPVLNKVDGSAQVINGNTKVLVSVTGPIEPRIRQELPNMACLDIIIRPSLGLSNTRENFLADKLRSILTPLVIRHKYPRQLIQIVVQVLNVETDSLILNNYENTIDNLKAFNVEFSDIINCCYFALIDSNIALAESFIAINQTLNDGVIVSNPKLEDFVKASSAHLLVFSIKDSKPNKIIYVDSKGSFVQEEFFKVLDSARDVAETQFDSFRSFVEEKLDKDFIWKQ